MKLTRHQSSVLLCHYTLACCQRFFTFSRRSDRLHISAHVMGILAFTPNLLVYAREDRHRNLHGKCGCWKHPKTIFLYVIRPIFRPSRLQLILAAFSTYSLGNSRAVPSRPDPLGVFALTPEPSQIFPMKIVTFANPISSVQFSSVQFSCSILQLCTPFWGRKNPAFCRSRRPDFISGSRFSLETLQFSSVVQFYDCVAFLGPQKSSFL